MAPLQGSLRLMLRQGDAFSLLPRLPSSSIDAVWTDPPYFLSGGGLGFSHGQLTPTFKGDWDTPRNAASARSFHGRWVAEVARILKAGRSLWVTASHHGLEAQLRAIVDAGLDLRQIIIWQKTDPPPTISAHHFPFEFEFLIWATKGKIRPPRTPALVKASEPAWASHSVWRLSATPSDEKALGRHPTQKPLELVRRCLASTTIAGDLVLDPFMGSGTTGAMAIRLGCGFVGFERERDYVELARRRLRRATPATVANAG